MIIIITIIITVIVNIIIEHPGGAAEFSACTPVVKVSTP